VLLTQVTITDVTLADATVPLPFPTVHVWPVGCVNTVTAYALPLEIAVENVNEPALLALRLLPPEFCRTTVPLIPDIVPPMVWVVGVGGAGGAGAGFPPPHAVRTMAITNVAAVLIRPDWSTD
jgi:hypothetical protein